MATAQFFDHIRDFNPLKKSDIEFLRRAMPWCVIIWGE